MLLSVILAAAVLIDGPVPESGNFSGEVAIEAFGPRGVVVYVDTNRDNSFEHLFRLQVEAREDEISASTLTSGFMYFNDANIEFAPGYVRISSGTGTDAIELFVENTQTPSWNPDGAMVLRRSGYGLIHEIRESGIVINPVGRERSITAEYCETTPNCDPDEIDGGG
jgi:hypothetical protein